MKEYMEPRWTNNNNSKIIMNNSNKVRDIMCQDQEDKLRNKLLKAKLLI
jgi:hypothetical protein